MADNLPITLRGKQMLDDELKFLTYTERPRIVKEIEVARSHGDISENAEYEAAKERQGMIEARIGEIQGALAGAEIVDVSAIKSDRIVFGATVDLIDLDNDEELTYSIVGVDEADVKAGRISIMSPIARSLIGKKEGDTVSVRSPKGDREFEIKKFVFK
ncbi:MAG: transcription elongation factor GreA [Proteobacteria bacterium]|nr:MAG: transcription elongation factor GreA [Pseudomonadota bacterium]